MDRKQIRGGKRKEDGRGGKKEWTRNGGVEETRRDGGRMGGRHDDEWRTKDSSVVHCVCKMGLHTPCRLVEESCCHQTPPVAPCRPSSPSG